MTERVKPPEEIFKLTRLGSYHYKIEVPELGLVERLEGTKNDAIDRALAAIEEAGEYLDDDAVERKEEFRRKNDGLNAKLELLRVKMEDIEAQKRSLHKSLKDLEERKGKKLDAWELLEERQMLIAGAFFLDPEVMKRPFLTMAARPHKDRDEDGDMDNILVWYPN